LPGGLSKAAVLGEVYNRSSMEQDTASTEEGGGDDAL
jgi:hypothetical protein